MKKFKLSLVVIALIFGACLITGCAKEEEKNNDKEPEVQEKVTVASTLALQFKEVIKDEKDIKKVAEAISKNEVLKIQLDVVSLKKKDYLSGFTTEIKGFKKAVVIRPMIGTIPFIAYVFEVENAEEFAKSLKENADLRWNVCTEADNMETVVVDNYVFFVMAPKEFEEE